MKDDSPPHHDTRADELLAIRCQLGERGAFEDLFARWHRPLWRYARNLSGSDSAADDTTQEVWLRVLRGIARLRDGARLRAWLFGIARRVLMDRLRARYARPVADDIDLDDLPAEAANEDKEQDLATMLEELARLPLIENEILTLFYLQELTMDDIAGTLGIPVGTVKSRLYRARNMLRRELNLKGMQA